MATYNSTESSWSKNPESITIGDHETSTFKFKYYSPGKNISISLNTGNVVGHGTSWKLETIENEKWVSVTVVGAKNGKGTAQLNVTTYPKEGNSVLTTTKINVVAAVEAHKIKFFDTDNNPLANNKLIAPKYICEIAQGEDDPNKGSKPSTSNKCLKTTDRKEYVRFKYKEPIGPTIYDTSVCSWVTLSDSFDLPMWRSGCICLNGIIDDTSRNITRDMLQINGKPKPGFTYWYILNDFKQA